MAVLHPYSGELVIGGRRVFGDLHGPAAYERMVLNEIQIAVREIQESAAGGQPIKFSTEVSANRQWIDAVPEGPTGRLIAVEIKHSTKTMATLTLDVMHKTVFGSIACLEGPGVMLLITRTRLSQSAQHRLREFTGSTM